MHPAPTAAVLALLAALCASPAVAQTAPVAVCIYQGVILLGCYDGDTCTYDIPRTDPILGTWIHKGIKVRVENIDTPEMQRSITPPLPPHSSALILCTLIGASSSLSMVKQFTPSRDLLPLSMSR